MSIGSSTLRLARGVYSDLVRGRIVDEWHLPLSDVDDLVWSEVGYDVRPDPLADSDVLFVPFPCRYGEGYAILADVGKGLELLLRNADCVLEQTRG
jgi:hypothetical protein